MTTTISPGQLTTLTGHGDIANAMSLFCKQMTANSDRAEEIQLGFQGGGMLAKVHWRSDLDLWVAFRPTEKRYWVAFGVGNPFENGGKSIIVEINSPFEGINRRIGGVFARDNDGRLYLGHRGRVGGGRRGIGQKAFMAKIGTENLVQILDGDRPSTVITIGALDAEDFSERVRSFVSDVEQFKADAC